MLTIQTDIWTERITYSRTEHAINSQTEYIIVPSTRLKSVINSETEQCYYFDIVFPRLYNATIPETELHY